MKSSRAKRLQCPRCRIRGTATAIAEHLVTAHGPTTAERNRVATGRTQANKGPTTTPGFRPFGKPILPAGRCFYCGQYDTPEHHSTCEAAQRNARARVARDDGPSTSLRAFSGGLPGLGKRR